MFRPTFIRNGKIVTNCRGLNFQWIHWFQWFWMLQLNFQWCTFLHIFLYFCLFALWQRYTVKISVVGGISNWDRLNCNYHIDYIYFYAILLKQFKTQLLCHQSEIKWKQFLFGCVVWCKQCVVLWCPHQCLLVRPMCLLSGIDWPTL